MMRALFALDKVYKFDQHIGYGLGEVWGVR